MKWLILIIGMMFAHVAYAQKDSVLCLSKTEVLLLANKIQLLQDSSVYRTSIISAQNKLITTYNERVIVYEQQLQNREQTIDLINKQNEEMRKQIESLRPKWYDDNRLWFMVGVGITTTIVLLSK